MSPYSAQISSPLTENVPEEHEIKSVFTDYRVVVQKLLC